MNATNNADPYEDLPRHNEHVLIVQLCDGERDDKPNLDGATRGAAKWVEILRRDNREVHAFGLTADLAKNLERILADVVERKRSQISPQRLLELCLLYHSADKRVRFPYIPALEEHPIDNTVDDAGKKAAQDIIDHVGNH